MIIQNLQNPLLPTLQAKLATISQNTRFLCGVCANDFTDVYAHIAGLSRATHAAAEAQLLCGGEQDCPLCGGAVTYKGPELSCDRCQYFVRDVS